MWTLIRADWIKTWKRPANYVLASIELAIVLVAVLATTIVALADGAGSASAASAREQMSFPHGFRLPLATLYALGAIIGIVFMASSIGSEYSGDTWKILLPRRGRRSDFVIAKLASCLFFMGGLVVTALVLGQALGLVGAAVLGGELMSADGFSPLELLRALAPIVLDIAVYAALTLLVTIVTRSAVLGIVLGVVATLMFALAAGIFSFAAWVLPTMHSRNLQAHCLSAEGTARSELLAEVTNSFGMEVSVGTSALVIVGYVVGCIAIALVVFHRRDMAGQ
jgi:ABC-2 type transport system permease protein